MSSQRRIVELFIRFLNKEQLSTEEITQMFQVGKRTAQRDLDVLKEVLYESFPNHSLLARVEGTNAYQLTQLPMMEGKYIYVLLKVLLASRALNQEEVTEVTTRLLEVAPESERQLIENSIANELTFNTYIQNQTNRAEKLFSLEKCIQTGTLLTFMYLDHEKEEHILPQPWTIRPVSVFFDNFYFFVVGIEQHEQTYRTFRVDWMDDFTIRAEKLLIDRKNRYEPGIKRQKTAFGYSGKPVKIQFEYYGYVEYVQDQFPSCRVIKTIDTANKYPFTVHLLEIEVEYSVGVKMWLLAQSLILKVTSPRRIAMEIREGLQEALDRYY